MGRRAVVKEDDMRRAIKAAADCGLTVRECTVTPDVVTLKFNPIDEQVKIENNPRLKQWPK